MKAKILKVRKFGAYAHLTLAAAAIARSAKPGQFVEVRIEGPNAPFWRRPFSICRASGTEFELLIKAVGRGSRLLCSQPAGAELDVIGPLGNGFRVAGRQPVVLVGGGFGVAPLLFLAETLKRKNRPVEVLIGGRCQEDLLLLREMKLAGATVACTTEDGSFGARGRVTKILEQRLLDPKKPKPVIAAAGPKPMLEAVAGLAMRHGVAAEVSLEEMMACGLGLCNGCVVKVAGAYQRVCQDGPVFPVDHVAWKEA